MAKTLTGKVALVTGASRGIGAAIARALAAEGANVAISYSSSPDKAAAVVTDIQAQGVKGAAFKADSGNNAEVEGLVKQTVEQFGKLDILVNNAGVLAGGITGDEKYDNTGMDRQLAINVGGVIAGVRAAAKVLPEGGRIITIGSCLGSHTGFPGIAEYSGSKAALQGYTRGWARDLGKKQITVNLVQPGPIDTDMNPANGPHAAGQIAFLALGRYGKPEDIAAATVFLASPAANFITGAILNVDGGFGA